MCSPAYPIKTLSAPNGVTRMAGAKAYAAKFAISPMTTANIVSGNIDVPSCPCVLLVMIPPHHTGLLRYEKPSPSKPCLLLASMRPFFVMTKLDPTKVVSQTIQCCKGGDSEGVPIAKVEVTASANPMYLKSLVSDLPASLNHGDELVFHKGDRLAGPLSDLVFARTSNTKLRVEEECRGILCLLTIAETTSRKCAVNTRAQGSRTDALGCGRGVEFAQSAMLTAKWSRRVDDDEVVEQ